MHTGIISLANRIVFNIKTVETKDYILQDLFNLYGIKIIQKHYHKLDENNIKHLNNNEHLMCLRFNGNPYLIYFTLHNDIPIIYLIDKKIHPGYQKPRILLLRGLFDKNLFKNTLIDGEMVKCNDGKWLFLINDILVYEGRYLIKVSLLDRLKILYNLLENQYTQDKIIDVCEFQIKKFYYAYKHNLNEIINLSKQLNYTARGIYLWSYNLRYKPKLHNFNENNIISVSRKVKDETEFQMLNQSNIDIIESDNIIETDFNILNCSNISENNSEKILWVSQTDYPDVYNLYDNDNILTSKKLGIALIPNLLTSKLIRLSFKNKNSVSLIKVKCLYNNIFNKWYPIEIIQ